mmetsp:Transcript_82307/g.230076  ORF Transcript_82307/g.230076 Transcript_82307/m.230076 type:complete len:604 (+) Transcript_82307:1234-3045(+)
MQRRVGGGGRRGRELAVELQRHRHEGARGAQSRDAVELLLGRVLQAGLLALLVLELPDLRPVPRERVGGAPGLLLADALIDHLQLGLHRAEPLRRPALGHQGLLAVLPPLPLAAADVLHAHLPAEIREVHRHGAVDALLQPALLLLQAPQILPEPLRLWPRGLLRPPALRQPLPLTRQVPAAPLERLGALAEPGLQAGLLLLELHPVRGAGGPLGVELAQLPVYGLQLGLAVHQAGEVEARGAVAGGLGVHAHVAVPGDRLAVQRDQPAPDASAPQLLEDKPAALGQAAREHDVAQEKLERAVAPRPGLDALQRGPQPVAVAQCLREQRVRRLPSQVVQGQERHGVEEPLLQALDAPLGGLARVGDDGVDEPPKRHINRHVELLADRLAQLQDPAAHAGHELGQLSRDALEPLLLLYLPLVRGDVLDVLHDAAPLRLQLLLLPLVVCHVALQLVELRARLAGLLAEPLQRRSGGGLGLHQGGDPLLQAAAAGLRLPQLVVHPRALLAGQPHLRVQVPGALAVRGRRPLGEALGLPEALLLLRGEERRPAGLLRQAPELEPLLRDPSLQLVALLLQLLHLRRLLLPLDLQVLHFLPHEGQALPD